MMRYSVQPRDQIFIKDSEFLSLAKNMCKNIGKNISKNLSSKYSQKSCKKITPKKLQRMRLKLLQKE